MMHAEGANACPTLFNSWNARLVMVRVGSRAADNSDIFSTVAQQTLVNGWHIKTWANDQAIKIIPHDVVSDGAGFTSRVSKIERFQQG